MSMVERLAEKHWNQWSGSGPLTERNAKRQVRFLLHAIADELEKSHWFDELVVTWVGQEAARWLRSQAQESDDEDE